MTPEEIAAKEAATAAAAEAEAAKKAAEEAAHSTPDPLKEERERIERKGKGRTELEKALHTRKQIDARIKVLKGDSEEELEETSLESNDEDDKPVTVGMLKKLEQEKSAKSALTLAEEEIEDENERVLVQHHLENSIKPSGNAKEDLRKARAIVNDVKNKQIVEETIRRPEIRRTGKGNGGPGRMEEVFEATAEEKAFMKPPFNMTKEKIIAARKVIDAQRQ